MGVGIGVSCKINANIGNSATTSNLEGELEKLHMAVHYGADTVMDLSTGGDLDGIRDAIIQASTIPVGTVRSISASGWPKIENLNVGRHARRDREQAKQGAIISRSMSGTLKAHGAPGRTESRIVSRGGSIMGMVYRAQPRKFPL